MQRWFGSSGVCINENGEILMVLQGTPDEEKRWSVPSGGKEKDESYEACCVREVHEETGYDVEVIKEIKVKNGFSEDINISYKVHYFLVKVIGGERRLQDPDHLIYDIAWEKIDELKELRLSFSEDREFLIECIKKYS
ncbi:MULTISPECIES: NUDIX hydrolase [Bacillaceae]|uniref:NUDIX hydrolase n=1 Tax=Evansella alkalicola TaxID=745819 RepID=A0ABS6JW11_9BACI|nr:MULTISPECIES: NUDIX hydrolase [Bacillaceae]MBU9722749.1 NUDIX hydrolase [Bacillus alkalicola]